MNFLGKIFSFFFFIVCSIQMYAQQLKGNVVQEVGCVPVKVAAFESLEQIALQWQIPVQQLEKVNKGLSAKTGDATMVNLPLSGKLKTSSCEGCSPVVHRVQKGEGLYRIGLWYGIIGTSALKSMNRMRSDALQPGQDLIVGYLHDDLIAGLQNVVAQAIDQKDEKPEAIKETEVIEKAPTIKEAERPVLIYEGEGFFRAEYKQGEDKVDRKKMKTATFKSESGWEDGRFYLLSNQIRSGVVVKVTNPANGEYLYAKVVGPLPDMKLNVGLQLRLSNAAAIKLGYNSEDEVHELDLNY
jgi:LysM repeat protein